jgi:outer membrane protein TolC
MASLAPMVLTLALAQAPPAQPALPVVTLKDAIVIATERNLDLKVLAAQLAQADEISRKAWARYLPQASVSGTWQRQKEVSIDTPFGNIPVQNGEALLGQVDVTQVLVSPSLYYGIRSAERTEEATSLGLFDARRALLFGVAQQYYAVASLKRAIEVAVALLELAERQEKDARVRYETGTIAKVALLRSEIDRARAEQDLKRAQNAFESARVGLATLLDRTPDFDVAEPPPPPLAESPDTEQLVHTAIQNRYDVRAARARLAAAEATRSEARGRYFPDVQGFGRYQRQNQAGFTAEENWAVGLQLQWQIYDGGLRESDVREARARIAEADAATRSAEARVRQDVVQTLIDLDSARANALKAREQRDLAAENQRLVNVSFKAGAATAVEVADATAALRTAEIDVVREELSTQLAALRVLQVVGEYQFGAFR